MIRSNDHKVVVTQRFFDAQAISFLRANGCEAVVAELPPGQADGDVPQSTLLQWLVGAEGWIVGHARVTRELLTELPQIEARMTLCNIGSCTNGRIEDLRAVAQLVAGRRVHERVRAMVVPGSGAVRRQAEEEGLAAILIEAGFEWRQPGCSMCLAMNDDVLAPGERCASPQ